MKLQTDKHCTDRQFNIGDFVYLRLQPYTQAFEAMRSATKLAPRYYGRFKALQRIGPVAYKLNLPAYAKIHPVFHVSCIKQKLGENVTPTQQLPLVGEDGEIEFEPVAVLD
ncbi:uncharacterized protein LOC143857666 [Tasmannia lanceolata]|uniref:uncharacterized protein LOC143857666 n=1 Tax=Tasmannia lanceolata TaxID=3420 RepID=UPI00406425D9